MFIVVRSEEGLYRGGSYAPVINLGNNHDLIISFWSIMLIDLSYRQFHVFCKYGKSEAHIH